MSIVNAQITLKDVARRAQCSTAVVSTVINRARGNTLVSPEMRRRVERAARELGYRPHFASRSLARQKTRTLGIYIPSGPWSGAGFAYEGEILHGIEKACGRHGYDLLLINLTGEQAPTVCLEKFAERRIDGLLLIRAEADKPWLRDLIASRQNVVAVDLTNPPTGLSAVSFDNATASRVALHHLRELGHRRVGFIGNCEDVPNVDATVRQAAFAEEAAALGLEVRPEWVFDGRIAPRRLRADEGVCQTEGVMAAEHMLHLGADGATAWLAWCDLVAVSAVRRLQVAGIEVPRQLSIMGVDDSAWCQSIEPPLTSVRHPLAEMGARAVEILIDKSERNDAADRVVREVLAPVVVPRASTGPAMATATATAS